MALKVIEVVYTPRENKDYIERLNKFLNPNNVSSITTAMWNDPIKPNGKCTKYFRTLVCFDFDSESSQQKCFSYSSPKINKNPNDLIFYILPNKQRINLNAPILIPTKEITILHHDLAIQNESDSDIKNWLIENKNDLKLTIKHKGLILEQYKIIKYNIENIKFDSREVQKAHNKMIDESKVEQFCKQELKLIEQQEQKNIETKSNSESSPGGLPSDDDINTNEAKCMDENKKRSKAS